MQPASPKGRLVLACMKEEFFRGYLTIKCWAGCPRPCLVHPLCLSRAAMENCHKLKEPVFSPTSLKLTYRGEFGKTLRYHCYKCDCLGEAGGI